MSYEYCYKLCYKHCYKYIPAMCVLTFVVQQMNKLYVCFILQEGR